MSRTKSSLFSTADYQYRKQMEVFLRLAAELGFIVYKPDYHGAAGDKGTILLYKKEDHMHNCEVDKLAIHYGSADEARLYGCTDAKYYYRPYFFAFENTDANGLFSYGFANFGKIDMRRNYDALENAVREAFAARTALSAAYPRSGV